MSAVFRRWRLLCSLVWLHALCPLWLLASGPWLTVGSRLHDRCADALSMLAFRFRWWYVERMQRYYFSLNKPDAANPGDDASVYNQESVAPDR